MNRAHGRQMMGKKKGPKNFGKTLKRLLSYLTRKHKARFIIVLICIFISSIAGIIGSLFLEVLINDYISPLVKEANPVFTGLIRVITIMGLIYLVGVIASFFYSRLMVSIAQGILKDIRDEMFCKMQKLPIKFFDSHSHGDLMSHYTNDTDTLRQLLSQTIPQLLSSLITIVGTFIAMIYTSWHLTIFVVIYVFLLFNVIKKLGGKSAKYFMKQQKSIGDINGYIEEMINGQRVVKVFNYEEKAKEKFNLLNEDLYTNSKSAAKLANVFMPVMHNLSILLYVFIAIIGGVFALNGIGNLTLGAIAAFLQLSKSFTNPISQVSNQINFVVMALAGSERIFELMDEEKEIDNGHVTLVNAVINDKGEIEETNSEDHTGLWAWKYPHSDGTITYSKLRGDINFYDVDFSYDGKKIILHDVSLYAEPGQKIAFVGATGAGKTTITNLINRFYELADGKIKYDGININKIKKDDLRKSLGIVLQETNLFTGTVMENIRYGRLNASDEEVIAASKLANADDFIKRLPNGYNTILSNDGSNLSQGQRQLLSIARAAVADAPVMILDEATSSIDTRTEALVQKGTDKLMEGRTVFIIAHRLSTVKNADVIMVLDNGRIIERGNHEKLINQGGKYFELYTGAFELD